MTSPLDLDSPSPPQVQWRFSRPSLSGASPGQGIDLSPSRYASLSSESPPFPRPTLSGSRPPSAVYLGSSESVPRIGDRSPDSPLYGIRLPVGIASARVGLGSPKLDLMSEWIGVSRGSSFRDADRAMSDDSPAAEEEEEEDDAVLALVAVAAERERKELWVRGLADRATGLPSPPRTDSDIALPPARPYPLPHASHKTGSPHPSDSRNPSSARPVISRSESLSSSSKASGLSSFRPSVQHPRPSPSVSSGGRGSRRYSVGLAGVASSSSGGRSHNSSHRRSGRLQQEDKGSKPCPHSPAVPLSPERQQPSAPESHASSPEECRSPAERRGSWEHCALDDVIKEEHHPHGEEYDERIRQAEEKIRQSTYRRPQPFNESPVHDLRQHGTYSRSHGSPVADSGNTLRRSATVSSRSAVTPNGDLTSYHDLKHHGDTVGPRKERSGDFGGGRRKPLAGLFTPPPKPAESIGSRYRTVHLERDLEGLLSASQQFAMPSGFSDGLERHSDTNGAYRDRSDYMGTSRDYREDGRHNGPPLSKRHPPERNRAESVLGTATDRHRYSTRAGSVEFTLAHGSERHLSRPNLTPSDSVSAVGVRSERGDTPNSGNKDPLEVLKRIEAQRTERNRQWDVERSASVLGDHTIPYPRPDSRLNRDHTQHIRPATSMSGSRTNDRAPRTAPVDRNRRPMNDSPADSPLLHRIGSRLGQNGPSSEPRSMRSSTWLGGRTSPSLAIDPHAASSDHGRLLFEAFRSVDAKIGADLQTVSPDFMKVLSSAARSAEAGNANIRQAIQLASRAAIELEVNPTNVRGHLNSLCVLLRDVGMQSDQHVRDLTRIMLDLPKVGMASASRISTSTSASSVRSGSGLGRPESRQHDMGDMRRWQPTSPLAHTRRSEEISRSSTSMDSYSPTNRLSRHRESMPVLARDRDRSTTTLLSTVGHARNLGVTPRNDGNLHTIEASPPAGFDDHPSPLRPIFAQSPGRPHVLRKRPSAASTIRGNSFLPHVKTRTTTAISQITAGHGHNSPKPRQAGSVHSHSQRSSMEWGEEEISSPASRFSFHTAEAGSYSLSRRNSIEGVERDMAGLGVQQTGGGADGVALGRSQSVSVAGRDERKESATERFRAALRRGTGRSKDG